MLQYLREEINLGRGRDQQLRLIGSPFIVECIIFFLGCFTACQKVCLVVLHSQGIVEEKALVIDGLPKKKNFVKVILTGRYDRGRELRVHQ